MNLSSGDKPHFSTFKDHSGKTVFFTSLLSATFCFCVLFSSAQQRLSERITQVENNLTGQTLISGEKPMNLQDRMKHYKVKGLSIAVIKDYKVDFAKAYGMADSSTKTTTKTLFQAASISKSFNALAMIKLFHDKKLDLYADINTYLKSWKFPYDSLSRGKKINTANLLSHTAGLSVHGFGGYEVGDPLPSTIQILNGEKPANSDPVRSQFAPGEKMQYSGGGTTISQQLLADITGKPYQDYLNNNILKATGMNESTFAQPPVDNKKQYLATGYLADGSPLKGRYHIYPEQAAAGLWTNPSELAKYIIETQLALQGKSDKVLNQSDTKIRLSPYENTNSSALGVFIESPEGTKYFGHGGSNRGFQSAYYGSLDGGNGLVIMVNSDNGSIIPEVINSIAKVYGFKGLYNTKIITITEVSETTLENYIGRYELAPNFILSITREGKQLYAQATGQRRIAVLAESQTKFFSKDINGTVEFVSDENGKIKELILVQGRTIHAKKL
ncbi:serine hydrolase [Pedobacter sp. MC2016-05]|uniref:serine hydrolase n=1 Tax=Pedobacter sp. MC2016-05 TaxID=2994474 RepID=UPI00224802A5|nr:serine hydrolase [Pedobacter sp. MC2016-05]MCX2473320.1 serine hydrolase [Pedobacter sp. MC2016-05]